MPTGTGSATDAIAHGLSNMYAGDPRDDRGAIKQTKLDVEKYDTTGGIYMTHDHRRLGTIHRKPSEGCSGPSEFAMVRRTSARTVQDHIRIATLLRAGRDLEAAKRRTRATGWTRFSLLWGRPPKTRRQW
jgi:hypothetical protein